MICNFCGFENNQDLNKQEEKYMATIKEIAEEYEPQQTLNITELEVVSTDLNCEERVFKEGTADEFRILVTIKDGKEYRVPTSVISALHSILEDKPTLKFFKVKKEGSGMQTKYIVIPVE